MLDFIFFFDSSWLNFFRLPFSGDPFFLNAFECVLGPDGCSDSIFFPVERFVLWVVGFYSDAFNPVVLFEAVLGLTSPTLELLGFFINFLELLDLERDFDLEWNLEFELDLDFERDYYGVLFWWKYRRF